MDALTTKRRLKDLSAVLDGWDPIGGCPAGEYDAYAPGILGLLQQGAGEAAILHHLEGILNDMGLGPEAAPAGARTVLAWYAKATGGAE